MNERALTILEYDKIKAELKHYTLSYLGALHVDNLMPSTDVRKIERWLHESAETKTLVSNSGSVPIPTLDGLSRIEGLLGKGFVFTENDFEAISLFLKSTLQLQQYLRRKQEIAPTVSSYVEGLHSLSHLRDELDRCIVYGEVSDTASPALHRARKQENIVETRLRKKLDGALQKYRPYLQESIVMQRSGHYVLAVRKDMRKMVPGNVLDESASGQTVFIEPTDVTALHLELESLRAEVEQEKYRVLCELSELMDTHQAEIRFNLETIGICDFVVAKGKYARAIEANRPSVNTGGKTVLRRAKHPLLGKASVPIDFQIGERYRSLLITGPNTGGKTVTLKTVGLLTIMAQSGLLIPVSADSTLCIFHQIWPDIGDGQSLEHSLSTFSAHVRSLVEILKNADSKTLVLLDELASGTDPGEGIALSIAVLEQLYKVGSTLVATTHFSEIKDYAATTEGFEVARMEFDLESLQPLYQLHIGEAGDSYALVIAQKLGMSPDIIARAKEHAASRGEPPVTNMTSRQDASQTHLTRRHQEVVQSKIPEPPQHGAASEEQQANLVNQREPFQPGDRVWIHSMKRSAIVKSGPDARGNLTLLVQKQIMTVNRKRVAPYLTREQLYPDSQQYDLDIVLESKDTRKKRKIMSKRHVDNLHIEIDE